MSATFASRAQAPLDMDIARRFQAVFDEIATNGLEMVPGPAGVEIVEYRTHPYSYIARVRIHHDGAATPAFVKLLRLKNDAASHREAMRRRVVNEFEAAMRVYRGFEHQSGMVALRPLGCLPDQLALITAEVDAAPLSHLLERGAAWNATSDQLDALRSTLSHAGGWLRRFQALQPVSNTVTRDRLVEYLDIRLTRLVRQPKARFSEADRTLVLRYAEAKGRLVPDTDLREVWTHSDFGPSNVLVNGGTVTVIDFAMAHGGTIFNDIARMYTQLEWFSAKPKFRPATIRTLQQALLAGFDPHLTEERPLFELMVLQHRINHFLGSVERGDGVLSRIYNWHLARRDRAWVRGRTVALTAGAR